MCTKWKLKLVCRLNSKSIGLIKKKLYIYIYVGIIEHHEIMCHKLSDHYNTFNCSNKYRYLKITNYFIENMCLPTACISFINFYFCVVVPTSVDMLEKVL